MTTANQATEANGAFYSVNYQRGHELVMAALREKRPIEVDRLMDLLNWACSAEGNVTTSALQEDGSLTLSYAVVPASTEPKSRLIGAIMSMAQLLNSLVAAGTISLNTVAKK